MVSFLRFCLCSSQSSPTSTRQSARDSQQEAYRHIDGRVRDEPCLGVLRLLHIIWLRPPPCALSQAHSSTLPPIRRIQCDEIFLVLQLLLGPDEALLEQVRREAPP